MGIAASDLLGISAERYVNFDDAAAAGRIFQHQAVIVVEKLLQAGAGVT
jgi:hypothetical protein